MHWQLLKSTDETLPQNIEPRTQYGWSTRHILSSDAETHTGR